MSEPARTNRPRHQPGMKKPAEISGGGSGQHVDSPERVSRNSPAMAKRTPRAGKQKSSPSILEEVPQQHPGDGPDDKTNKPDPRGLWFRGRNRWAAGLGGAGMLALANTLPGSAFDLHMSLGGLLVLGVVVVAWVRR